MTLAYKLDVDILKMYPSIKMKILGQDFQTLEREQDKHKQTS